MTEASRHLLLLLALVRLLSPAVRALHLRRQVKLQQQHWLLLLLLPA
jgi:hypothetical protein